MPVILNWKEVKAQSDSVFNQFGERWQKFAKENVKLPRKDIRDFRNVGVGKHLLCIAMGESTEEQIDIIKKYRDKVEIVTCDKGFKPLLEHGVKADYVMTCDTNVPFRFLDGALEETKGVKLLATPYANLEWTQAWKGDLYFYVNKDSLGTEKIFLNIFPEDTRTVPAGSNVSNAMLIFFTGSDGVDNTNYSGYEKYILVGYDYSWRPEGNYYAWSNPTPKRYYMSHRTLLDYKQNVILTSENLLFSAKWLFSYITAFHLPTVNCSDRGLLEIPYRNLLINELSGLDPSRIKGCREAYNLMRANYVSYGLSQKAFEQSRTNLYSTKIDAIAN